MTDIECELISAIQVLEDGLPLTRVNFDQIVAVVDVNVFAFDDLL